MTTEIGYGSSTPLLKTINLTKRFGGLTPTRDLSMEIYEGEIRCIIGPNGAGKSTFFNLVTGFLKPTSGEIWFMGKKISSLPPHQICRMGIGRKFQVPSVFYGITVLDNLKMSVQGKNRFLDFFRKDSDEDEALIQSILETINLEEKKGLCAEMLSHGEKQWLEIGMVLANKPNLILLDEPTAGMTNDETTATVNIIEKIADKTTVMVIEHDINFIRNIAKSDKGKVTVLNQGSILSEGSLEEVTKDQRVKECYLGKKEL